MANAVRVAAVQAEPKWLHLQAGVDQTIELIAAAAHGGARLIAFPELFVPGYPWWHWLGQASWTTEFAARYRANSLCRDDPGLLGIADAARRHHIHVVIGFAERVGESVFPAQAVIDERGRILAVRRRQWLTRLEHCVLTPGPASDPVAHNTAIGRLGALSGAENLDPVAGRALRRGGERIHVAGWPGFVSMSEFALRSGTAPAETASRLYAMHNRTFVIAPCAIVPVLGVELSTGRKALRPNDRNPARIYGPDGAEPVEPLAPGAEGLLFADLDLAQAIAERAGRHTWRQHGADPGRSIASTLLPPARHPSQRA